MQLHTFHSTLSFFTDWISLIIVAPISSPRSVWRRVSPWIEVSYFPMCLEIAAADVAMAFDSLTSSGSNFPSNCSFSCGLRSKRSITEGDIVKISWLSDESSLIQRFATMFDRYSGFIPSKSLRFKGFFFLSLSPSVVSFVSFGGHVHKGQMSFKPIPAHPFSPRPSGW